MATVTDAASLSRANPCFVRNRIERSERFDQIDPKSPNLDPPEMTLADEDHHTERSPSKRKIAIYEPERTPGGTAPNCARKRRSGHALSRATPTPSHGVKMSGIFQDAAVSLKTCFASPTTSSSNMRKSRTPVRQAQMGTFGFPRGQDHFVSPQATLTPKRGSMPASTPTQRPFCEFQKKLDPSGDEVKEFGGPNRARPILADHCMNTHADNVTYPNLNLWKMRGFSSVPSSLSSDCHSSHGVPVVIPIHTTSHEKAEVIDTWLSEVYEPDIPSSSDDSYAPQSSAHNLDAPQSPDHKPYAPQSPDYRPYAPQSPDWKLYEPQSPDYQPYAPESPDSKPYAPQSPGYQPYAPQPPDHKPYAPQSPDHQSSEPHFPSVDLEQQQGSISRQNSTFQRSPKRPITPLHSLPKPLVVHTKNTQTEMPMSASSINTANPLSVYPILPCLGAIQPSSADCRSTPSPSPTHSFVLPHNLRSFPPYEPLRPSAESGPPTPHPSPISYTKHKKIRIGLPLDIPIDAPAVRRLTRQMTSLNEMADLPVKELSPHVERYRKGYAPQQGRRPSYWDREILGVRANGQSDGNKEATLNENSGKNRTWDSFGDAQKAVGESERSETVVEAKAVTRGTENAKSGLRPQK